MKIAVDKEKNEFKVYEHLMTKNFWEYFILDDKEDEDIREAFVMGFENEFGLISMSELTPYIISKSKVSANMELMPPAGMEWL